MTDLETPTTQSSGQFSRRTVIKGAAWSVPVIAVAVATPFASASVANAGVTFTGTETGLLSLNLLDGSDSLTAGAAITVPDQFTIANGPGAISGVTATVTVVVGRPAGINLPLGAARGFGVYSLNGNVVAGQNSVSYAQAPLIGNVGFPITTFSGTLPVTIASNGALVVPIVFGLSGETDLLTIQALATFPVTLTIDLDGNVYTANSTITVPVGAGLL
jgi:hypothetical protein